MTQILRPINGPSPNVGSGLTPPYGIATDTTDGLTIQGTGVGLGANGIAGGTMTDATVQVVPSTRAVAAVDSSSPNVNSGLAGSYPTSVINATTETLPTDSAT